MKFELRGFQLTAGHDDTIPYRAELFADGQKVADVSNDGWGGSDMVHGENRELFQRVVAFAETLPALDASDLGVAGLMLPASFDLLMSYLVHEQAFGMPFPLSWEEMLQ